MKTWTILLLKQMKGVYDENKTKKNTHTKEINGRGIKITVSCFHYVIFMAYGMQLGLYTLCMQLEY